MDATRDYHIKQSKAERERQIPRGIAYVETKIWHKLTYTQSSNGLTDMENRLVVAKREGAAVGLTGSLGLVDANYDI